jgi:ABC-type glutathione transport system ATPase component
VPDTAPAVLVEVRGLTKQYEQKRLLSTRKSITAIDNLDFRIEDGSITALVGASGSGKSTLARCMSALETPTAGSVLHRGLEISRLNKSQLVERRRKVQLVFQNSELTLNPRFTAVTIVAEPLTIARIGTAAERRATAIRWMQNVGLDGETGDRPALEFSGGQRQRLVIARSLTLNPELIIFDESFSMLDFTTQARIFSLLKELQSLYKLTYIFISHDLTLLARICSEAAVMYHGKVVERAPMRDLLLAPVHPHTKELVRAMPTASDGGF